MSVATRDPWIGDVTVTTKGPWKGDGSVTANETVSVIETGSENERGIGNATSVREKTARTSC